MASRSWLLAGLLATSCVLACSALNKTEECSVNADCSRGTTCSIDDGYCRTGGPITIGYLAGITGLQAKTTEERRVALEFGRWIVERDPSRKVLGRGIAFRVEDTLGQPTEVPAAATRLINTNIAALIGPGPSGEVLEAQKTSFPLRLLHLAPSGGAPSLGEAQPQDSHQRFLFQMVTGVADFVPTVALFLGDARRPATYDTCFEAGMAIVASEDTLGLAIKQTLESTLQNNCVTVTQSLTVPVTKKATYATEVEALMNASKEGKPTRCAFFTLPSDVAGELLRALKAREKGGSRPAYNAFIGGGTLNSPVFVEEAKSPVAGEPSYAEGFYGIDADGSPDRAELRDLEALWQEYLATQSVIPPGTPFGTNRVSYAEAVVVLALAIELAGTVEDPVALRDALVDVTGHTEGDQILGPRNIDTAFKLIRTARQNGRRAAIDYRGSYSNLDFDDRGFVRTGTMVWRAQAGKIERALAFSEEQLVGVATANPGPACAKPK
jgi:hypothetical protein